MSTLSETDRAEVGRWQWWSLLVGCIAMAACIAGAPLFPSQFFRAYLAVYLLFLGIGLGGMALLMLYYVTGGVWGVLVRRLLEAEMRTLPLLAVLFVPNAVGVGPLYLWAQPKTVASSARLQYQQFYLDKAFFWGRVGLYFLIWTVMALLFSWWSAREDKTGDARYWRRSENLAGPGLVIYGLTIHFASMDWVMSLQPLFPSTVFAPVIATGQVLTAHAFALVMLGWLAGRPPASGIVSLKGLNDVGNALLALLAVWGYMVWFQFMIVWIADLPEDVVWFLPASRGGWLWVGVVLMVLHFAVPFLLLLARAVKQDPRRLAGVAALIVFMQLVFDYLQVVPHFQAGYLGEHWMDFVLPLGIGGIWLAYFLHTWQRWPAFPEHDYNRQAAMELRRRDEEEASREEALAHG